MTGPTRATTFPATAAERKQHPIASGVLDYFPDALVAVSHVSWKGNEQHHPGTPLHWDRSKSADEADALMRHFLERGTRDTDGIRHSAKMAWRALALLQKEIEAEAAGDGLLRASARYTLDDLLKVGDKDSLSARFGGEACGARVDGYVCTRPKGHVSRHVACVGEQTIVALGPSLPPTK